MGVAQAILAAARLTSDGTDDESKKPSVTSIFNGAGPLDTDFERFLVQVRLCLAS